MAGPNSYPAGDRAEHARLMQKVCINNRHIVRDKRNQKSHRPDFKTACNIVTIRESLVGTARLRTGKTRA